MRCRLASTVPRHGCGTSRRSSSSRPATPNGSVTGHGCPKEISVGVDAMLEHRAVLDQMHPKASLLALAPDAWIGQPDLGHQVAMREHCEHARVDLVGLARQWRQAFDLGRIGDQHVPAERFEAVVREPRTGHRLDHRPHRPLVTPHPRARLCVVGIGRRRELLDDLASR